MGRVAEDLRPELIRLQPSPRKDTFLAFDSTFITEGETAAKVLAEQPDRHPEAYGMFRAVTPSWGLWGPDGKPDVALCRQLARQYATWGVQCIAIDNENELTSAPDPRTLQPLSADQRQAYHVFCQTWIPTLKEMKAECPAMMLGLFGALPLGGDYPDDTLAVRAVRQQRDQMAIDEGLIDVVDAIFPEFYISAPLGPDDPQTWDVRQASWEGSLTAQTDECRRMFHKRVIPYLCAHPRNAATQDVSDLMPAEIWKRQVTAMRKIADGWVQWGWRSWMDSPPHADAVRAVLL